MRALTVPKTGGRVERRVQGCVKPAGKRLLGLDESPKSDNPKFESR
jgi:hypothetical protein